MSSHCQMPCRLIKEEKCMYLVECQIDDETIILRPCVAKPSLKYRTDDETMLILSRAKPLLEYRTDDETTLRVSD